MKVTAKLNNLRIAPRKTRLVANLIRRKKVEEAQAILNFTVKKSAPSLFKLLNSAIANANNNFQLDSNNLYISEITVDEGRKNKRWRPRARGRAGKIEKKTSHITLILEEIKPTGEKKTKKLSKDVKKKEVFEKVKKEETEEKIEDLKTKEKQKEQSIKQKLRPVTETPKPKDRGGIKRMFRRKSF